MTEAVSGEMLEEIMKRCTSKRRVVIQSGEDVQYVAFRRKGYVNAVAVIPGVHLDAKQFNRRDLDTVIQKLGAENILETRQEFADGPVCIAHYSFERHKEYEIPEGAELVRRGDKNIRFFVGEPKPFNKKNKRRRKFRPVPATATLVRADGTGYEWFMPCEEGKYDWIRDSELKEKTE
jgi:hypothetical protein